MNPNDVLPFVLNVLGTMYCCASWIEAHDHDERSCDDSLKVVGVDELSERYAARKVAGANGRAGAKTSAASESKLPEQADDGEVKSIIPGEGPLLSEITLGVLATAMPRVIERASIAQTIEILLALTSISAYREGDDSCSPDLLRKVYTALWSKLGDGRALNDGQVVYLGVL